MKNMRMYHARVLLLLMLVFLCPAIALAASDGLTDFTSVKAVINTKEKVNFEVLVADDGSSERISIKTNKGVFVILDPPQNAEEGTETTLISDRKGKKISIDKLAVPCEVRIRYRPNQAGDPVASQITVLKALAGASKAWPAPVSK